MLLALALILSQTSAARPTPAPSPVPNPRPTAAPRPALTAIPRSEGANAGLAGAATRIKLNRSVSFKDLDSTKPVTKPTALADGTPAAAEKAVVAGEPGAPVRPDCDTATFKSDLDAVVARFAGERTTARATPRIALAGQVSHLRAVQADFSTMAANAPPCASAVVREAGAWMRVVIESLDAFLGKNDTRSVALEKEADDAWRRYQGERHYLP